MAWLLTTLMFLSSPIGPPSADVLPSSDLSIPLLIVTGAEPANFDLLDVREDWRDERRNIRVEDPHSKFVIKRHVGASIGYDNTILHGSVGLYMTIAELGRWNFGVPSVAFGAGRYPTYDRTDGRSSMQSQPTVFVSIASVHYRMGYVRALGYHAYLNLEQVYDLRHNMSGSQFGVSFSTK
jgi:hypothetical protein